MLEFELGILDFIQSFAGNEIIDNFWVFLTRIGDKGMIWIVLSLVLLAIPRTRKVGLICVFAVMLSGLITNLTLKPLIGRARPFNYSDIELLIDKPTDFSFPSGHTSIAFAVAFSIWHAKLKIKDFKFYILVMILAILVSFSRLYLYVHFPTDIIASVVLAYGYSVVARKFGNKLIH